MAGGCGTSSSQLLCCPHVGDRPVPTLPQSKTLQPHLLGSPSSLLYQRNCWEEDIRLRRRSEASTQLVSVLLGFKKFLLDLFIHVFAERADISATMPHFMWCWRSNLGLHACWASTLTSSAQPQGFCGGCFYWGASSLSFAKFTLGSPHVVVMALVPTWL